MANPIRTLEDKSSELESRRREQRELGAKIDRALSQSRRELESEEAGCGPSGLCPRLARALGLSKRESAPAAAGAELAQVREEAHRTEASKTGRMFGGKQTASAKLEAASVAVRRRVENLEKRAAQHRESATSLMRAGKKADAVRELKKARLCEKQAATANGVMDAMEQQHDLIEQTEMQKEVAAALGATAKTMKKGKKLLGNAEDAVDTASEMRDLGEDLASVMNSLGEGASGEHDEDDLLEELERMAAPATPPDPTDEQESLSLKAEHERKAALAMEALAERHRQADEAKALRRELPAVPAGPVGPAGPAGAARVEKASLLSSQG